MPVDDQLGGHLVWRTAVARIAAVAVTAWLGGLAVAGHPFRFDGRPPVRAVVAITPAPPSEPLADAAMARRLAGQLAELRGRELKALIDASPLNPAPTAGTDAEAERTLVFIHLEGRRSDERRVVEIVRGPDGRVVARDPGAPSDASSRAVLREGALEALMASWPRYRGGFEGPADDEAEEAEEAGAVGGAAGRLIDVANPLEPSPITLDEPTLKTRMYRGMNVKIEPASRDLDKEIMILRRPGGYTPREPAPLLVWVSPTTSGIIPPSFEPVLDELGMAAIGMSDTGNTRHIHDRLQLSLDAVATASARWHIDPERVYVSGMSGGGRTAGMLWGVFPDVFMGAAPIVGLNSYFDTPAGPNKIYPKAYARPDRARLRDLRRRPLAAVTGTRDFNDKHTRDQVRKLARDGMSVKLFTFDMAHEIPAPDKLAGVIRWMDEPAREARAERVFRAQRLLDGYLRAHGPDAGPPTEAARRDLVRVMEEAPWSKPAWVAYDLLGSAARPSTP